MRFNVQSRAWRNTILTLVAFTGTVVGACDTARPVRPANRSPIVQSLTVFPSTIAPGDSAIVVCYATDPDGDTVVYDWTSDCRLVKKGDPDDLTYYNAYDRSLVVYAGQCVDVPVDTGWVSCHVRDGRGGGADAGHVLVIVRQP